jgi:hypothetical protein
MYAGVPSTAPVRVSVVDRSPGRERGLGVAAASVSSSATAAVGADGAARGAGKVSALTSLSKPRARPKSVTTTWPSRPSSTLAGLKSRCTSPRAWAATSPAPAARRRFITSAGARRSARSHSASVPPSSSSIATKSTPLAVPTS